MNDKGFKVAGHPRHKEATPSPPAGNVCRHSKTAWQPDERCPSHVFLGTDTPDN